MDVSGYSRRLDFSTASKLTIREVIATSPDPRRWQEAFDLFGMYIYMARGHIEFIFHSVFIFQPQHLLGILPGLL